MTLSFQKTSVGYSDHGRIAWSPGYGEGGSALERALAQPNEYLIGGFACRHKRNVYQTAIAEDHGLFTSRAGPHNDPDITADFTFQRMLLSARRRR